MQVNSEDLLNMPSGNYFINRVEWLHATMQASRDRTFSGFRFFSAGQYHRDATKKLLPNRYQIHAPIAKHHKRK